MKLMTNVSPTILEIASYLRCRNFHGRFLSCMLDENAAILLRLIAFVLGENRIEANAGATKNLKSSACIKTIPIDELQNYLVLSVSYNGAAVYTLVSQAIEVFRRSV
jgi:hypothetical protein